uniref:DUF6699 domain-containing protein n=1 Tax=Moniliophthora roreri TaxID=221103 RepID=A0A0W0G5U7_MONRR
MRISFDNLSSAKRGTELPEMPGLYPYQHSSLPNAFSRMSLIPSPPQQTQNTAFITHAWDDVPEHAISPPKPPVRPRGRPCIPLPSQLPIPAEIRLHRRLQIHTPAQPRHEFSNACLSAPATQPPLPSMTLTLVHPNLPHHIDVITVHRSMVNPSYVTVHDVFAAIGQALTQDRRLQYLGRDGAKSFAGLRKSNLGGDIWEVEFRT